MFEIDLNPCSYRPRLEVRNSYIWVDDKELAPGITFLWGLNLSPAGWASPRSRGRRRPSLFAESSL